MISDGDLIQGEFFITSKRENLSQNICSAKQCRILKQWNSKLYSDFINIGLSLVAKPQCPSVILDKSDMNIQHSSNFKLEVIIFLELVNVFDIAIMIMRNSYINEEIFFFFKKVISGLLASMMGFVWMLKSHKILAAIIDHLFWLVMVTFLVDFKSILPTDINAEKRPPYHVGTHSFCASILHYYRKYCQPLTFVNF